MTFIMTQTREIQKFDRGSCFRHLLFLAIVLSLLPAAAGLDEQSATWSRSAEVRRIPGERRNSTISLSWLTLLSPFPRPVEGVHFTTLRLHRCAAPLNVKGPSTHRWEQLPGPQHVS